MRISAVLLFLTFWSRLTAQTEVAYQISTLAGAPPGFADGTGAVARFDLPVGIALDASGNCYVADQYNFTIRKIAPGGSVTTLAGTAGAQGVADGAGPAARFLNPTAVAVDHLGTVFVLDDLAGSIRKISPSGVVSTFKTGIYGYDGIAVDGAENLYLAGYSTGLILKVDPSGTVTTLAGSVSNGTEADGQGSAAIFNDPEALAVDSTGTVYVADQFGGTIRKITPGGLVSTVAALSDPTGVTFDAAGNLYVAERTSIRKITPSGVVSLVAGSDSVTGSVDGQGATARFAFAISLASDGDGNLYVSDMTNQTIRTVTSGGLVSTYAGVASPGFVDGANADAKFSAPTGATVDRSGNVYVADVGNNAVRKIDSSGSVSTYFSMPGVAGVAVDSADNLYVSNRYDSTIRKIFSNGTSSIVAGSSNQTGSSDGTGASARFNYPQQLAVDPAGNIYVIDGGNQSLRKVTPAGVVSTFSGLTGPLSAVAADATGNVFVGGLTSIYKIAPGGSVSVLAGSAVAGSADGNGTNASFSVIGGLVVDAQGNLIVSDLGNGRIRLVTPGGQVSTLAGSSTPGWRDGLGSAARFDQPDGLALDSSGRLYIVEELNNCVRWTDTAVPTFVSQPVSQTISYGQPASFSISLPAGQTATIQWLFNGNPIAGATGAVLTLSKPAVSDSGAYSAQLTNAGGIITSVAAVLTVQPVPPQIQIQPLSLSANLGGMATFSVDATGDGLTYQWSAGGLPITGATAKTLTLSNLTPANRGSYTVQVSGPGGSTTSAYAYLAVIGGPGAPAVTLQPVAQAVATGSSAVFTFVAGGSGLITAPVTPASTVYQWYANGIPLDSSSGSQLVLYNTTTANSGTYYCVATKNGVSIASDPVTLVVVPTTDVGRLVNCSVLTSAGPATPGLTVGFTTQGAGGSQPLLIRGIGPTLTAFGLSEVMPDPQLTLISGSSVIATNAGWGSPATNLSAVTAADNAVHAFSLNDPTSLDAALVTSQPTNHTYTVQIGSTGQHGGSVLAEVYDASVTDPYTTGKPRLTNLSCLSNLPASGTLTAGFTVAGSAARTVLIRAVGPGLQDFGLPALLPDPVLTLHTNSSGADTILNSNSGWGGTIELLNASSKVGAFNLPNANTRDGVILITLSPGTYTAQVTSASQASGFVIIEVYELP